MSSKFDYIKYDSLSMQTQARVRELCESLEIIISNLGKGRSQSEALTNLENFYAWAGKAIRDHQIARGGSSTDVPERGQDRLQLLMQQMMDCPASECMKGLKEGTFVKMLNVDSTCEHEVLSESFEVSVFANTPIVVQLFTDFPKPPEGGWCKITCNELGLAGYYRRRI